MRVRMKRFIMFLVVATLLVFVVSVDAETNVTSETTWYGEQIYAEGEPVQVEVMESNQQIVRLKFDFRGFEVVSFKERNGSEIEIPGEGHTSVEGVPSLPKVSRLIAIPAKAKVRLSYTDSEIVEIENIDLLPTTRLAIPEIPLSDNLTYNTDIYSRDENFPGAIVELGEPAILRDLRVLRVTVNPIVYNPVSKKLGFRKSVDVSINFEPGGTINTLDADPVKVSRSFSQIYASKIVNFNELDFETDEIWGSMLVIYPSTLQYSTIQPLVDWKNYRGIKTIAVSTAVTGSTASQIKAYVQQCYDTWDPKLAYLLIIGDSGTSVSVAYSNSYGDHEYSQLEGNDILADISVGRFSCDNTSQLQVEVSKVVNYEFNPFMGTIEWYQKGAVCAGSSSSGLSTIILNRAIRYKALEYGYTSVDTLWYNMGGSVPTFINNNINSGIGFLNYRGYIGMSGYTNGDINALTNYNKLPFVVTITCGTGDITGSGSDYTEEFFRVGTVNSPKGAIGAIGTATASTHTRFNNCVNYGIWGAIFDYGIFQFGDALVSGKLDLFNSYPDNLGDVTNFSYWNNLIGDPTCQLRSTVPLRMVSEHPDTIPIGTSAITVTIRDMNTNLPLPGTDVHLTNLTSISIFQVTDETGELTFDLPPNFTSEFYITAYKHNYIPHKDRIQFYQDDVFVNLANTDIDDDNSGSSSGNANGDINPGETIELSMSLHNFGNAVTATNVSAHLSTESTFLTITDPDENFPNLTPGQTSALLQGFIFSVSQDALNGPAVFNLSISSDQGNWETPFELDISAPDVVYLSAQVQDPNGQLDPGDQSPVVVTLLNAGGFAGDNIAGELSCTNDSITVVQNVSGYGLILPGGTALGQAFTVYVSGSLCPGTTAHFVMEVTGDNNYYNRTTFDLPIGTSGEGDPIGPDGYGYFAIDDTDLDYSNYPYYSWMEIDPYYGGSGNLVPLTDTGNQLDDTELIALPFPFQYYGESFNQVSICSNGWLAFGNMTYFTNFRNWYIPSTLGPYSLVAPFWDDLYLMSAPPGKVYYFNDSVNHRFIVEWSRVRNYAPTNPVETFEVILLDPAHHPTPTGDGEIIFQFQEVHNVQGQSSDNHYATVGIKSNDNLDGLQYSYWNNYPPGAAELQAGRAIRFTTSPPFSLNPLWIEHEQIPDVLEQVDSYPIEVDYYSYYGLNYNNCKIHWRTTEAGLFNEVPLQPPASTIPGKLVGSIPEQQPGNFVYYYIEVQDVGGRTAILPETAPDVNFRFIVGPQTLVFFDDAETANGWLMGVQGDNATTGIWVREDPVASYYAGVTIVQPEDDHTPVPGHICYVTGNAPIGAPASTNDVDGGKTTLMSPTFDMTAFTNPYVSYWYWYSNSVGGASTDHWRVDVSDDHGLIWHIIQYTTENTASEWAFKEFRLLDYCQPTNSVQFRFIASDYIPESIVEACVDDFKIFNIGTSWGAGFSAVTMSPSSIVLEASDGLLKLSWQDAGEVMYKVYRGDRPDFNIGEGEYLGQTSENEFYIEQNESPGKSFFKIVVVE